MTYPRPKTPEVVNKRNHAADRRSSDSNVSPALIGVPHAPRSIATGRIFETKASRNLSDAVVHAKWPAFNRSLTKLKSDCRPVLRGPEQRNIGRDPVTQGGKNSNG